MPDTDDLEYLYNEYFEPAFWGAVTAQTWDNPEQLLPENFAKFYAAKAMPKTRESEQESVAAKDFEGYIQSYFNVSPDFLRKAEIYDEKTDSYIIGYLGGGASAKVVGAKTDGEMLMLNYEYYSPADDVTVIRRGTLRIKFETDGYKYVSCATEAVNS